MSESIEVGCRVLSLFNNQLTKHVNIHPRLSTNVDTWDMILIGPNFKTCLFELCLNLINVSFRKIDFTDGYNKFDAHLPN